MSAPRTTLEWLRWACAQTPAHELDSRQGHLLQLLAGMGNQHGEGRSTRGDLAAFMACSEATVKRVFGQLVDRGLAIRQGHQNRSIRWRLNTGRQPAAQLSLDDSQRVTQMTRQDTPDEAFVTRQMTRLAGHPDDPHRELGTKNSTTPLTPQGGNRLPVGPGPRGRQRERLADLETLREHAAVIFDGADQELALQVVRAARGSGVYSHDEVRAFAREWYPQLEAVVPA